ncbi:retrovirus-related pol polyprotein from transposon TNT 1-94 [Tanacetum coccineum]
MTSGHMSSGLDLTYAPSTITTQKPTEPELDLLFKAMYDDNIGGQLLGVWELVPPLDHTKPLTLKWLFKNKHDEENKVIRNKTRLVVRGYRQEEGIDFENINIRAFTIHLRYMMNQVKANNRKEQKIGGFDLEMENHNVINIMSLLQDDDMEEIQVANMVGLQTVRELEDEFVKKFCMTILKLQEIVNDYDQNKNKKKKKKKKKK